MRSKSAVVSLAIGIVVGVIGSRHFSPRATLRASETAAYAAASDGIAAQPVASDLLVGTWKTDATRSITEPPPFASTAWTVKIERTPEGYKGTGDGVNLQGQPYHSEFLWRFDGQASPTGSGLGGLPATYTFRQIDDYTFVAQQKNANGSLTSRMVVSPEGRMRVNFHVVKDANDRTTRTSLEVMYKQPASPTGGPR